MKSDPKPAPAHHHEKDLDQLVQEIEQRNTGAALLTIAELRKRGVDLNATLSTRAPALCCAVIHNNAEVMNALITAGVNPNASDANGWTAAHFAAVLDRAALLGPLKSSGADLCATNTKGWQPIHAAALKGNVSAITRLMELGADPNAPLLEGGGDAVHIAAGAGQVGVLTRMAEKGTSLTQQDAKGWQAIHAAATNGHLNAVRCLVEHGVDANARGGSRGRTAFDIAKGSGHKALQDFLGEREGRGHRHYIEYTDVPKGNARSAALRSPSSTLTGDGRPSRRNTDLGL